jgi:putative hydrolase of the HAD superfamily
MSQSITRSPDQQITRLQASAVFFDVDFTLIYPGPTFQGEGYRDFCARYGIAVDPRQFGPAVAAAAPILDEREDDSYSTEVFVAYTRRIIERMGGRGPHLDACAREIYDEWAASRHFELYDDVRAALDALAGAGIRIGVISNTHRCLESFLSHFALDHLIAATVSSFEHGYMKPHPSIFCAALARIGVPARKAVMVGDSVRQDIEGALAAGMRAILLDRTGAPHPREPELAARGVPTIRSLDEVLNLVIG